MNKQKWILGENGLFYPIPAETVLHLTPGPGIFKIAQGSSPTDKRIGLLRIQEGEKFEFLSKRYSLGNEDFVKKVLDCWNSDRFINNNKNLAVGLTGLKGAGKTYLAKEIANRADLPILILDNDFDGAVVDFITSLEFECVIMIDEAEKIFNRNNGNSHILLRIIDGVSNVTRKLYLITTNQMDIDDNFLGRPGRLRYIKKFISLPPETVDEIIREELDDQSKSAEVRDLVNSLTISTIDIVRSIIEEFNTFGELDRDSFNLPLAPYTYHIINFDCAFSGRDSVDKIEAAIKKIKGDNSDDLYDWLNKKVPNAEDDSTWANRLSDELDLDEYDCCPLKMTTTSPMLFLGLDTSLGTILDPPDDKGYFIMKYTDYRDTRTILCKLVRESGTTSLYYTGSFVR